jgi:hypothetical protein
MYDSLVKKCSQFSFLGLRNGINSQKRRTYAFIIKRSLALAKSCHGHRTNKLIAKALQSKAFRCLNYKCMEISVLMVAILGVICGAEGWTDLTI